MPPPNLHAGPGELANLGAARLRAKRVIVEPRKLVRPNPVRPRACFGGSIARVGTTMTRRGLPSGRGGRR